MEQRIVELLVSKGFKHKKSSFLSFEHFFFIINDDVIMKIKIHIYRNDNIRFDCHLTSIYQCYEVEYFDLPHINKEYCSFDVEIRRKLFSSEEFLQFLESIEFQLLLSIRTSEQLKTYYKRNVGLFLYKEKSSLYNYIIDSEGKCCNEYFESVANDLIIAVNIDLKEYELAKRGCEKIIKMYKIGLEIEKKYHLLENNHTNLLPIKCLRKKIYYDPPQEEDIKFSNVKVKDEKLIIVFFENKIKEYSELLSLINNEEYELLKKSMDLNKQAHLDKFEKL